MAWPYDALLQSFSALTPVPSSVLNGIQTQINNIAGSHIVSLLNGIPAVAGGWIHSGTLPEGWERAAGGGNLIIPIPLREGAVVSQVEVKIEGTAAGAWSIILSDSEINWDSAATAPAAATVIDSAAPNPGAAWAVTTLSGGSLPRTLAADKRMWLQITAPFAGDHVAGVRITRTQLY